MIEGNRAYMPPGLFAAMQEVAVGPLTEEEKAEEYRRLLQLTSDEYSLAKVRGLDLIVDYEMEDLKR